MEHFMKTEIFKTLETLNLTSLETRVLFNERTSDVDNLKVWKDSVSQIIYIDDFYTGDNTYVDGAYRADKQINLQTKNNDFESASDAQRRFDSHFRFVAGKKVVDFGCGRGDFLRLIKAECEDVFGVELQQNYVDALNDDGITCFTNLDAIENHSIDVCVSFHVLEHLPNPLEVLEAIRNKMVKGGVLLIEVPHANDFLLSSLASENFKQFTLWSQHLVLHTRESLRRMLGYAGFNDIHIQSVQRYPLSNHLHWLAKGEAGGHKSALSFIDTTVLTEAYENSLARIDATDTLVAIAKAP
jgi:2-polyprenyl-3-methyl-5-hydroxy-6-metoxy-1,4-benzoquinol methylase